MSALRSQAVLPLLVVVVILAAFADTAVQAQFFTLAPGGPSGYVGDAIYGPIFSPPIPAAGPPFPPVGFGPSLFIVPPPAPLPAAPPGTYFIDALSSGTEAGSAYIFSVAAGSLGLPGSPVAFQAAIGTAPSQTIPPGIPGPPAPPEQMGDLFYSGTNFVTGGGHPMFGIPALSGPLVAAPIYRDEFALGLNVGDNVAALQLRMPLGAGTALYSLGPAGVIPPPYTPADIISPVLPFGVPWAPAAALGLVPGDDIDALIAQDLAPPPLYVAGIDVVAFSLAPGSPTLGVIGAGPADLLLAMPVGPPVIYIPAAAFGLLPGDNLDAIDVVRQPGDYSGDGIVNATDYVVWRKTLGTAAVPAGSGADGNFDGSVNLADYTIWRSNYGLPFVAGAGASLPGAAVPEPATLVLLILALAGSCLRWRRII